MGSGVGGASYTAEAALAFSLALSRAASEALVQRREDPPGCAT